MNRVYVLGMGPGSKDYILPITEKIIRECDLLIGGKRNLQYFQDLDKECIFIQSDLEGLVQHVKKDRMNKKIAFLLSGDTGFYSMLHFLKKHFHHTELEVVPGISSYQYLAAKIGETWNDAYIGSLHGRDFDFLEVVDKYNKVFLLTDHKNSPKEIAKKIIKNNIHGKILIVGENLSYENEKITIGTPEEIKDGPEYNMSVVVIKDAMEL